MNNAINRPLFNVLSFLIFVRAQGLVHLLHSLPRDRVAALAHDFAQRSQGEFPLGEKRVGNVEPLACDHLVVLEEDVDIDRPRGVGHARTGFLDRFGRAVAAQFLLDGLHGLKHLERLQVGGYL